jgi:hypothetical protein
VHADGTCTPILQRTTNLKTRRVRSRYMMQSDFVSRTPRIEYLDVLAGQFAPEFDKEVFMLGRILISAGAASVLLLFAGSSLAKEKKTTKAPHIYTQVECTGMKNMHWDDATKTCQKNK